MLMMGTGKKARSIKDKYPPMAQLLPLVRNGDFGDPVSTGSCAYSTPGLDDESRLLKI
jgi:hypothetical protein